MCRKWKDVGCWEELCLVSGVTVPWQTSLSCLHIQMKPVIQSGPTWTGLYESVVGETKTFMWWIYNVGDSARNSVCWILEEYRVIECSGPCWAFNRGVGGKKICPLGTCWLGLTSPVCSLNNLSWWECLELIWSSCLFRAGLQFAHCLCSSEHCPSPGLASPHPIPAFGSLSLLIVSLFISPAVFLLWGAAVFKDAFSLNSDSHTRVAGLIWKVDLLLIYLVLFMGINFSLQHIELTWVTKFTECTS